MVPQTTTQISRPLPPSRPIPPTPPRGTIYVVERFGRFSRLLPGSGPPLLPLVDRVIAAYARRVDQATPPEGLLAVLPTSKRVFVHAKWSFRVTDPRKLAYRISDVDRCVDMLIHVRIRDTVSTIPPSADLDDPSVLKRVSDAIRAGVDTTAARFGVSCPHFKVLTLRLVEEKPRRSLNLADLSPVPDYYTNGIETVLPELPREADPGMQPFSPLHSLSPLRLLPPPININYPQPIAYPQPPQPPRRQPALASVRLPPPLPTPSPSTREAHASDDDSLYRLHDSQEILPRSQSFRELPTPASREQEAIERPEPHRIYTRSQSLPQLLVSDEETLDSNQPPSSLEGTTSRDFSTKSDEALTAVKPGSEEQIDEEAMGALPVSDDESVQPLPLQVTQTKVHELPRDTSYLTDDTVPPSQPPKREVLYAPPPSPTVPSDSVKISSVLPEALSNALATDMQRSFFTTTETLDPSLSERNSPPPEGVSRPPDETLPLSEHEPPLQVGETSSAPPERVSAFSQGNTFSPEVISAPSEDISAPSEIVPAPPKDETPLESTSLPLERMSPPPERVSPPLERISPPEGVSPLMEHTSLPLEDVSAPLERVSPPTSPEQMPPTSGQTLPSGERAFPSTTAASSVHEQSSHLPEQSSDISQRASPLPTSLQHEIPSDAISNPLVTIFSAVAPTPHSELPSSERSSDPPSDSQGPSLALSSSHNPDGSKKVNMLQDQASDSTDVSYKDAVDQPMPSSPMLAPVISSASHDERGDHGLQSSQTAQARSVEQPAEASQQSQTPTSLPVRAGGPLLGPPMISTPMRSASEQQPVVVAAAGSHLGSQTADPGSTSQTGLLASVPPRAPTPPMIPISTSARGAASGQATPGSQHNVGVNRRVNPLVAAEGLGPFNPVDSTHPLPLNVGTTHTAEVDSRARHAISQVPHSLYNSEGEDHHVRHADNGFSSVEAVRGKEAGSDSEDTNMATELRPISSPQLKREPRKRRQHVQTASLFSSVVGKAERAIKSAGASFTSDINQMSSNSPRNPGSMPQMAARGVRTGLPSADSQQKPGMIREVIEMGEAEARRQVPGMPHTMRMDAAVLRDEEMQRRGPEDMRGETHPRRDGKRLRTTEEEESLSRREHARREKLMDELDSIQKRGAMEDQSSDDDSTRMMIDEGSDEERERFDDEVMSQSGAHVRRRRQKTRHRRRHTRHEDDAYDTDDSSSDGVCTDCGGHHHHHEGPGSSSHRKGRSKSRSRRSEGSRHERSDHDSEPRSVSRSRSGRERKSTSENSVDSHRSGRSSSRDRHRSKKSSSRDRKIEKSSSSTRSRSRDGKRSHSKSRSSSRKRDGEDKKRKESKSKSRGRDKRGPRTEQLEYMYQETDVKSIYRHRLPESESGPENPIPWYCEGQSQPEDTDLDDEVDSSDSDNGKRSKTPMYSSYGRRDRYGRRHRARHSKRVTFLYDNQR